MPVTAGRVVVTLASFAAMLAAWAVLAWLVGSPTRFPSPLAVAAEIRDEAVSGRLWSHMAATLSRVAWAFGLAMAAGTALGVVLGLSPRLDRWLDPAVVLALNLPALVVIVLAYLWLGLNEAAAILAVAFNKTALVLVTVREGTRALDPEVGAMARVYRFSPLDQLRHVLAPQLAPYLSAAARNGLAIIWKLVLVVEFLGRPDGIGFRIHMNFQLFDVAGVLAYAFAFIVVMLAIEYLAVQPVELRARRWRAA
ncbi:ABC transporter permease subunit [Rhodobacterales bacterium HKCCE2091]|nr:ABC transporter permease subunit [Rhodobacterales bacterium HKCCE2091]